MELFIMSGIIVFFVSLPIMLWIAHTSYELEGLDVFFISLTAILLGVTWPLCSFIGLVYGFAYGLSLIIKRFD